MGNATKMKASIYNPYLDTLGGGERYVCGVIEALLSLGWQVDLEWNDPSIKEELEKRFDLDLSVLNIVTDIKRGESYELCFWVSDGSVPLMRAKHNILHFQVPFTNVNGNSLLNKMKLFRIKNIVVNSQFTKKVIDQEYGVNSVVLYPPISVDKFKSKRKENIILYVGRFSSLKQNKGQEYLISAFEEFVKNNSDWKLLLAGGVEIGADDYLKKLEEKIGNLPIEIIKSPDFETLTDLYARAKFFWSAAGYGVDEAKYPEKVEHFGITVVEACASKCVPIVYNAGGYKEIVDSKLRWQNYDQLIEITKKYIVDYKLYTKEQDNLRRKSDNYSIQKFIDNFNILL